MAEELSKSAKRRAAKKARDAAAGEAEQPAPAQTLAPAAPKAKAAASAPAAAGYPEAKAKPKAKTAPAPEPAAPVPKAKAKGKAAAPPPAPEPAPVPEPKAKAKGKAKAVAEPAPAPEPPAPKAAAKSKAPAKAKAAAKAPVEEPVKKVEVVQPFDLDDGTGDAWEVSTGLTKKQQKRQEKLEEEKKAAAMAKQMGSAGTKYVPGFNASAGGAAVNTIPGMGPAGKAGGAKQSQSVSAGFSGVAEQIKADKLALEKNAAAQQEGAEKSKVQLDVATVTVEEKKIGVIIGPKGQRINELKEKSGVTNIETNSCVFTITGPAEAVEKCRIAIEELNTLGYTSLLYEDFGKESITVNSTLLPEIIGKKGVAIIAIKEKCGVEIDIPKDTGKKKTVITIAGSKQNAQKARECIEDIKKYYHHEITHPGMVHEEMQIESYQYAWIIGKAGSEMRHIQKNFEVKVNIPRDGDENENVVIVGEPKNVARAKTYIEKTIWNAENNVKSGGRGGGDKADDYWGDEEEEEPWMKQYLYKRK